MNDEYEIKILHAIAGSGTVCFQKVVDNTKMQRNKARKTLQNLMRKGEVKEDNRKEWKRGRKLFFKLTDKGSSRIVKVAAANIEEEVRILDTSAATIESLDDAIANAKDLGFKQVLKAIRDYGRDKVHVSLPPPKPEKT